MPLCTERSRVSEISSRLFLAALSLLLVSSASASGTNSQVATSTGGSGNPHTSSSACDCTRIVGHCAASAELVSQEVKRVGPGEPAELHWVIRGSASPSVCARIQIGVRGAEGATADQTLGQLSLYRRVLESGPITVADYQRVRSPSRRVSVANDFARCDVCADRRHAPSSANRSQTDDAALNELVRDARDRSGLGDSSRPPSESTPQANVWTDLVQANRLAQSHAQRDMTVGLVGSSAQQLATVRGRNATGSSSGASSASGTVGQYGPAEAERECPGAMAAINTISSDAERRARTAAGVCENARVAYDLFSRSASILARCPQTAAIAASRRELDASAQSARTTMSQACAR